MGKVIFEKTNGKTISLPLTMFNLCNKIPGLYAYHYLHGCEACSIVLDKEISKITFDKCKIEDLIFKQMDNQSLEFTECDFNCCEIRVVGGNVSICDSKFNEVGLDIEQCNKVSLLFNKQDSFFDSIHVSANNVVISGSIKDLYDVNIMANTLNVNNLEATSEFLSFFSHDLDLRNSIFQSKRYLDFGYNNLQLKNVLFMVDSDMSYYDGLTFTKIIGGDYLHGFECQEIAKYFSPVALTDSDILGEKNQTIYSLLSVLKGYCNQINAINRSDIKKINSKLNSYFDIKKAEISRKQEELTQELEKLNKNFDFRKKQAEGDLSNRKVKQLTYPKE